MFWFRGLDLILRILGLGFLCSTVVSAPPLGFCETLGTPGPVLDGGGHSGGGASVATVIGRYGGLKGGGGRIRFALGMTTVILWRRLVLGPSGGRLASERAATLAQAQTRSLVSVQRGVDRCPEAPGPKGGAGCKPWSLRHPEGGAARQKEAAGLQGHPALPCPALPYPVLPGAALCGGS